MGYRMGIDQINVRNSTNISLIHRLFSIYHLCLASLFAFFCLVEIFFLLVCISILCRSVLFFFSQISESSCRTEAKRLERDWEKRASQLTDPF